jgi:hypothetical protein
VLLFALLFSARPDMKAAWINCKFPQSPNPFALAETAMVNVMAADVGFCPVTLAIRIIKTPTDKELPYVVTSVTRNCAISESQNEIHPMFSRAVAIIVKTGPRAWREVHFWHHLLTNYYAYSLAEIYNEQCLLSVTAALQPFNTASR